MSFLRRLAPAVVLGTLAAAPAGAADAGFGVTVTGRGEIRVAPDEAVLTVGVETVAPALADAKSENDRRAAAVIAAARAAGVSEEHVRTDFLGVRPVADRARPGEIDGYEVRKTMALTLTDLARFEGLLTAVLDAGANRVHGVEFRSSELRAHRDAARSLAVRAAREKAEAMAAELGREIGPARSIQEGPADPIAPFRRGSPNVWQDAGGAAALIGDATALGQITVNAEVTVTFDLAVPGDGGRP